MSRMIGTVSMGLRAPIIRDKENLAEIVVNCIRDAVVYAIADLKETRIEMGEGQAKNISFIRRYRMKDGYVAIKGWTEKSQWTAEAFFADLEKLGVSTVICTDISRDGAMKGTNRELYKALSGKFSIDLIASGGVSSIDDIAALKEMGLHGAIIGKAYYTGAIDLSEALEVAK